MQSGGATIDPSYYRIGEFAARAGVTVRTVRYYDHVGLLSPTAHSDSGQRLYSDMDFARLQQILTLKLIGLSLDEIRGLLTTDTLTIQQLLARQKQVLTEQMRQLTHIINTLDAAERTLQASPNLNLEQFIDIIKAVNMNTQADWFSQFLTDNQQRTLSQNSVSQPLDQQRQIGEAWKSLFADVVQHIDADIYSVEVQQLVTRWDALMGQVTHGDRDVAEGLNAAYAHIDSVPDVDNAPDSVQDWARTLRDAAAFIQRARDAQSE